jgi:hypothetical protein
MSIYNDSTSLLDDLLEGIGEIDINQLLIEHPPTQYPESLYGEMNPFYGKKHTEEYKKERSRIMMGNTHSKGHIKSPETIEKHRLSRMGYTTSDETKKKIGEANKGKRKGLNITEEWRQNIMESCGAKKVMGPDGTIYDSIKGAAKILNTTAQTIRNRARKELFGWKFVD